MKVLVILGLLAIIVPPLIYAAETDNFTHRYEEMSDARGLLDQFTNLKLSQAVFEVENQNKGCSRIALYQSVRSQLASEIFGQVEKWAEHPAHIDNRATKLAASIYGYERNAWNSILFFIENPILKQFGVASIARIGPHIIGVDKLGHFMAQGWSYFKRAYDLKSGKPSPHGLERAFKFGEFQEKTVYGLWVTRIYSYGDLAANYHGMRFWHNLLDSKSPYVRCHKGHFEVARPFSWSEYVTDAWDEAINCSEFSSKRFQNQVYQNELSLTRETGKNHVCPVSAQKCGDLLRQYGGLASHLISPMCIAAGSARKGKR